jgi:cytochrome c-type biogenesis protein CcmE
MELNMERLKARYEQIMNQIVFLEDQKQMILYGINNEVGYKYPEQEMDFQKNSTRLTRLRREREEILILIKMG